MVQCTEDFEVCPREDEWPAPACADNGSILILHNLFFILHSSNVILRFVFLIKNDFSCDTWRFHNFCLFSSIARSCSLYALFKRQLKCLTLITLQNVKKGDSLCIACCKICKITELYAAGHFWLSKYLNNEV